MSRVFILARQPVIEPPFGVGEDVIGHRKSFVSKSPGSYRHEKRLVGLALFGEIAQSFLDEVASWQ